MFVNMCYSIDCWHCDAKSPMECVLYGTSRTCPGRDVSSENNFCDRLWAWLLSTLQDICFVEQRQRKGKLLRVRQGCQQDNACEVQKRQNFQTRIITKTNCRFVPSNISGSHFSFFLYLDRNHFFDGHHRYVANVAIQITVVLHGLLNRDQNGLWIWSTRPKQSIVFSSFLTMITNLLVDRRWTSKSLKPHSISNLNIL